MYEYYSSENERGVQVTIQKYLTLTFDSNIISVLRDLCCNLHNTANICAVYERPG